MRPARLGAVLVLLAGAAACAAPLTAPRPSPEVSVAPHSDAPAAESMASAPTAFNTVNPCLLITPADRDTLGLYQVSGYPRRDPDGALSCGWGSTDVSALGDNWVARLRSGSPFPATLDGPGPVRRLTLAGYQTLEGSNPLYSPDSSCVHVINFGPSETLESGYGVKLPPPGMTRAKACGLTTPFSNALIKNLKLLIGH